MSDRIDPFSAFSCSHCPFERTTASIEAVVNVDGYPVDKRKAALGACILRRTAVRAMFAETGNECTEPLKDSDGESVCRYAGSIGRPIGSVVDQLTPVELANIHEAHNGQRAETSNPPTNTGQYL